MTTSPASTAPKENAECTSSDSAPSTLGIDFVRAHVINDNHTGRFDSRVQTRFPPEPNGYLHLGHAKSICLNFGLATEFGGKCNLRFDDTNPTKESQEYVDAIKADVEWLGLDWGGEECYASNYFEELYKHAESLILAGKAYVDSRVLTKFVNIVVHSLSQAHQAHTVSASMKT